MSVNTPNLHRTDSGKTVSPKTFLIMAAGTGGHVYPALGFADLARKLGHSVSWLGTSEGIEARVVPDAGIELNLITISGVRGKGLVSLIAAPLKILRAVLQARKIIKNLKPDLVIGFGGYIAGPGGVASKLSGIPLVVHEQNAIAGTTNKLLSRIASERLCAFESALPNSKTVGNPVREDILSIVGLGAAQPTTDIPEHPRMLIIGGSLGARFLNQSVPKAIAKLPRLLRPEIRHQAGPKMLDEAIGWYKNQGVEAQVTAYIDDMAEAYDWADFIVCRAGAMTVSELAAVGLPSVLVPFPYAIDDHQTANANWLVKMGAAEIYQQSENNLERFSAIINDLIIHPEKRQKMSESARGGARRDATKQILDICEMLCEPVGEESSHA